VADERESELSGAGLEWAGRCGPRRDRYALVPRASLSLFKRCGAGEPPVAAVVRWRGLALDLDGECTGRIGE